MATPIDDQISKAEEAASKATAQAAQLRAEREAKAAADKGRADRARDAFEEQRREEFTEAFARPVDKARLHFDTVVAEGGDHFAAYMAYRKAHAEAKSEHRRFRSWLLKRATGRWELQNAITHRFEGRRAELSEQIESALKNIAYSPTREARNRALPAALTDELAKLNQAVNEWAASAGLDYHRELGNHAEPMRGFPILGSRPSDVGIAPSWPSAEPMAKLLDSAIDKAAEGYDTAHLRAVTKQIRELT